MKDMQRMIFKSLTCWVFRRGFNLLRRRKLEEKHKSRLDVTVVGFCFFVLHVCMLVVVVGMVYGYVEKEAP